MQILRLMAAGVLALTAAPALAAGPGLGASGVPSPGLGTPGLASPGLGAGQSRPATAPSASAPRPSYAPIAPIARVPEPAPAGRFKPYEPRSTYNNPASTSGYPNAPKPRGYLSPY